MEYKYTTKYNVGKKGTKNMLKNQIFITKFYLGTKACEIMC